MHLGLCGAWYFSMHSSLIAYGYLFIKRDLKELVSKLIQTGILCYSIDRTISHTSNIGELIPCPMHKTNKMRRCVETSSLELCSAKKMKMQKASSYSAQGTKVGSKRRLECAEPRAKCMARRINVYDCNLKEILVQMALEKFLRGRRPINTLFYRYLGKFERFGIYSLAYATALVEASGMSSKSDIRSFIYIFLAFNILSSKYLSDFSIWNHTYISDWGITLLQASQLEIVALSNIDYNLEIKQEIIERILADGHAIRGESTG